MAPLMPDVLSMSAAKSMGRTRYFTGVPCPRGHVAERIVSTRACTECSAERKLMWSAKNRDKRNAQQRAYQKANREKVNAWKSASQKRNRASANARNQRYAERHRDKLNAKTAAWAKAHPEMEAAKAARYRASKLQQTPVWADQAAIGMMYRAAHVYRQSGFDVHVDHIVPLQGDAVSGLHVHGNLQIIAALANRMKSNVFIGV